MKKELPLKVLKALEKYVNLKGERFEVLPPDGFLLKIKDIDPNSDFYFNIIEYKLDSELKILIDRKPFNQSTTQNTSNWVSIKALDGVFNGWVNLLKAYELTPYFYDNLDLKTKRLADEYYCDFEVLEAEEEDYLKPKDLLLLEGYLNAVEQYLDANAIEENKPVIEDIKNDILTLKKTSSSKQKKWVLKKVAVIIAKAASASIELGNHLFKLFRDASVKAIAKQGVTLLFKSYLDS